MENYVKKVLAIKDELKSDPRYVKMLRAKNSDIYQWTLKVGEICELAEKTGQLDSITAEDMMNLYSSRGGNRWRRMDDKLLELEKDLNLDVNHDELYEGIKSGNLTYKMYLKELKKIKLSE